MVGSNENHPAVIRPANIQEGLPPRVGKLAAGMGHYQRALSAINRNIVGAHPYPCAVNKRPALFENNGLSNKNHLPIPPIPTHRPITSIIDVDDYEVAGDSPIPMFVQHTEAMLEEIDRMEVEMEDTTDEPVDDIKSSDKRNPLAVVEYIDDIYAYYKKVESSSCVWPNYMGQQFDINERMRGILVDWLIEVHYKFELMDETLYLTVNLIDRFLAVQPVGESEMKPQNLRCRNLISTAHNEALEVITNFGEELRLKSQWIWRNQREKMTSRERSSRPENLESFREREGCKK
ncbi:hypothetical protein HYC85_017163 [Camellia sinensis]|uniref:Cyclin N-terminal domain-containing protein n=1 Tax=Camellia sinensis TaxID=4442 RepID=A0A7J7H302_CAMSI|nr:hypothetical protein HYC85_017163 [Camellia sinensis]